MQFRGMEIQHVAELYEVACERVCLAELLPSQLIFSDELGARRGAIAMQAIYSNIVALAGLALLAYSALPIAAAIKLSSPGRSSMSNSRWGVNLVPFTLFRFRCRRADGRRPRWARGCAACAWTAAAIIERDPRRDGPGGTASARSGVHTGIDGADAVLWAAPYSTPRHPGLEPAQLRLRPGPARRAGVARVRPVLHQAHVSGAGCIYYSAQFDGDTVSARLNRARVY